MSLCNEIALVMDYDVATDAIDDSVLDDEHDNVDISFSCPSQTCNELSMW